MWSAVASEARHRFGIGAQDRLSQSAVAAALCRRTQYGDTAKCVSKPRELQIYIRVRPGDRKLPFHIVRLLILALRAQRLFKAK